MVQEIAIRVRLREQDRLGLAEYERIVGSVATVAALTAWLPTPDTKLVLRGRGAEPVRLETVTYGSVFEMLVVLDHRSAPVERAAAAVAALVESVRGQDVADNVAGVAGELDRLDRAAPRGRSVAERSLRALLEGARADVLERRTTTRVRAAQALLRLAEDGAALFVERVDDALAAEVEEQAGDVATDTGAAVVAEPVDGLVDDRPRDAAAQVAPLTAEQLTAAQLGVDADTTGPRQDARDSSDGQAATTEQADEQSDEQGKQKADKKSGKKSKKKSDEQSNKQGKKQSDKQGKEKADKKSVKQADKKGKKKADKKSNKQGSAR